MAEGAVDLMAALKASVAKAKAARQAATARTAANDQRADEADAVGDEVELRWRAGGADDAST